MKINKIQLDNIKARWDILKMASAYIHAERKIIDDASLGIDTTGHMAEAESYTTTSTAESFHFSTAKQDLFAKAVEVRRQLEEAINNEEYEKASLLQELLDTIERKYGRM